MDIDGTILQLIPAHRPDMWLKSYTVDGGIFFQNVCGYALIERQDETREIITLVLDGTGTMYEADGHWLVYSDSDPNAQIGGMQNDTD